MKAMDCNNLSRRELLSLGALGLTPAALLALRRQAEASTSRGGNNGNFGRAKSCIVLFAWGGMSHLDTWDPKPDAENDVRGEFVPIRTSVPGIHVGEHLPLMARQAHRLAIVRSVNHAAPSHRSAAYWNLTGHAPFKPDGNWKRTRREWPSIGSMVAHARRKAGESSGALGDSFSLPYPIYDGGWANGQNGGFLGLRDDPVIVRPPGGAPYDGKSPEVGHVDLEMPEGVDRPRLESRRKLLGSLEASPVSGPSGAYRRMAFDLLSDPKVRKAFEIDSEPEKVRRAYGDHVCGRSVLQARKLVEAGVPLVTVYCAAGDLNGSKGAHFDTHADNFNKLKNHMLPPLDRAGAALLNDLAERGRLEETLVVWLTEFGRTPKINGGAGRDHYPNCYSVAFAGGGIGGGQIYGSSDRTGAEPASFACGPPDLHATIFHALGIDPETMIFDSEDRPYPLCEGKPLPLFG